jgi:type IV secretion system protein VirD4
MAGYGLRAFLIAQSLNQIEKAYGPNNSILDNCHVRVAFATNDERTAKRISDALGTTTELRAQRNYAGHRLSPWLGHLMVSRQETARALLTPGEVMQLPPDEEIIMVAGHRPMRAKKLRYFEDRNFTERILPPPPPSAPNGSVYPTPHLPDWTVQGCSLPLPRQTPGARDTRVSEDDGGGPSREPELSGTEGREFEPSLEPLSPLDEGVDEDSQDVEIDLSLQRTARLAALDPADGLPL